MNGKNKAMVYGVLVLMLLVMGAIFVYYYYEGTNYVTTEDAKIAGDLIKVSPKISGRLLEFNVEEGQQVKAGDILARQDMVTLPDNNLDLSVIRAPISGWVVKKSGVVNEVVSPGQPLAILVDLDKLYVNANVKETDVKKVKPGQLVEMAVDAYNGKKIRGEVDRIGEATTSTFSLLPASNSGSFVKNVQWVPVRIKLVDTKGLRLFPGMSVVTKIHLKSGNGTW